MHGGKSLKGVASGTFKHGKYSKDLVANLQEGYQEELQDPKLTELRNEIAVARSYIREIMREGESGKRWSDVEAAFWELNTAIDEGDPGGLRVSLERLHRIIRQGRRDWAHRSEIMQRVEALRRLTDSEHKHIIDSRMAVTHEQLAATLAAYVDIVAGVVNQEQLREINGRIAELRQVMRERNLSA
jgi:hypothetical protein